MTKKSTRGPIASLVRVLVVAGIAAGLACGSNALANAHSADEAGPRLAAAAPAAQPIRDAGPAGTGGRQADGGPARSADDASLAACSNTTLSRGSTGGCVYVLQDALFRLGFRGTDLDGKFGPATEAVVKSYQSAVGLAVDGIVGRGTWNALRMSF